MARRRGSRESGGRASRWNANRPPVAPRVDDFDEIWLNRYRENFSARYVDLTRLEDRRRWSPYEKWPRREYNPRGLLSTPRIVVVPEGHKLARLATYGGRRKLQDVIAGNAYEWRNRYTWRKERSAELWGKTEVYKWGRDVPRRVGFHMPWQVVICVRRKKRREVMHALQIAGRSGVGRGKKHKRNAYSEVVC